MEVSGDNTNYIVHIIIFWTQNLLIIELNKILTFVFDNSYKSFYFIIK